MDDHSFVYNQPLGPTQPPTISGMGNKCQSHCSAAGKATVGLALCCLCITDSVLYPPVGLVASEREVSSISFVGVLHLLLGPPCCCGWTRLTLLCRFLVPGWGWTGVLGAWVSVWRKVRLLYSTAYAMTGPASFTISEVAVDWQEPMALQLKLQPSNCTL